ncbi:MAG: VTT domain-containing protein [Bacteroidota bacterium]|nr:MAG: VTT domain-containing protein [Bacteroidota bacterium]
MINKKKYFINNLLVGTLWLLAYVLLYFIFNRYVQTDFLAWLQPLFDRELAMFIIFLVSEVIIGIIPPEIFMIWALRFEVASSYFFVVALLSLVSYLAGVLGYFIGRYMNRTYFYQYLRKRWLRKLDQRLESIGFFLIIIAALTPVPFSGVAMLVGSVKYSFKKYLFYSSTRFLRFVILALVFWEAHFIV